MKTRALVTALAVAGGMALTAGPMTAQESGTFVLTQNGNEVATEEFTRSADMLENTLTVSGQAVIKGEATLGDGGTVDRLELRVFPAGSPDAEPAQTTAVRFANDSVYVEQPIGTDVGTQMAPAGTVPFLNPSPSHMEQVLRRARAMGGDSVTVQLWVPGQGTGQVVPAQVAFDGESSATLTLGAVAVQLQTDAEGRVLGGEVPSQGLVIERQ